jgi:hypothetical protein
MWYIVYTFQEVEPLTASNLSAVLSPTDLLPWLLKFFITIEKSESDRYKWRFFNHYLLKAKRNCSYISVSFPKSPAAVFLLMNYGKNRQNIRWYMLCWTQLRVRNDLLTYESVSSDLSSIYWYAAFSYLMKLMLQPCVAPMWHPCMWQSLKMMEVTASREKCIMWNLIVSTSHEHSNWRILTTGTVRKVFYELDFNVVVST